MDELRAGEEIGQAVIERPKGVVHVLVDVPEDLVVDRHRVGVRFDYVVSSLDCRNRFTRNPDNYLKPQT